MTIFGFDFGLVDFSNHKATYEMPGSGSGFYIFQVQKPNKMKSTRARRSQENVKPKAKAEASRFENIPSLSLFSFPQCFSTFVPDQKEIGNIVKFVAHIFLVIHNIHSFIHSFIVHVQTEKFNLQWMKTHGT